MAWVRISQDGRTSAKQIKYTCTCTYTSQLTYQPLELDKPPSTHNKMTKLLKPLL